MEKEKLQTGETQKRIQEVSRAFPFAFRSPEAILRSLEYYKESGNRIPIIEIFLGHKTKESLHSKDMLAPVGGKILPGESPLKAAYRRIEEETALSCSPISEEDVFKFNIEESFNFSLIADEHFKRKVYFVVIPVINPEIVTGIHPNQEDSKVDRLIGFSIDSLNEAFEKGEFKGLKLQGHITKIKEPYDISITRRNRKFRNKILNTVINILQTQELRARSTLYDKLVYFIKITDEDFIIPVLKNTDKKDLIREKAEKLEDLLIALKIKLGWSFNGFFTEVYSAVLGELYMDYFRNKEEGYDDTFKKPPDGILLTINKLLGLKQSFKKRNVLVREAEEVKKRIQTGNFSVDVLHFLPLFISSEGSIKGKTTRLIVSSSRLMKYLIGDSIKDTGIENFEVLKKFYLGKEYLLQDKLDFANTLDINLIGSISKLFNVTPGEIANAWMLASRFIPDLAEETKYVDPEFSSLYQFHELRNEVANASVGQVLLLAFGIDIKENNNDWPIIKFEALRQLVFFLKILLAKPNYERIISKKPHPVDFAINTFFGPVVEKKIISLGEHDQSREMPITYRKGGMGNDLFIIDEKPVKPFRSVVRKSFEERVEEIVDIQSCAIILPDERNNHLKDEERIKFINEQADGFTNYLKENYPSWDVEVTDDKNTFANFEAADRGDEISKEGKRTGSKGDLLIRRKLKLRMNKKANPDETFLYEMVFYPFESFSKEYTAKGLMGWKEKIEDDPAYTLRRILFPLRGALGMRSLYELLYPPSLYPELIDKMRTKTVSVFKYTAI